MLLELPVTLYCIISNCILGQPRSHGPLLLGSRVGEELGFHGNEVALSDYFGDAWSRLFQLG